MISQAFIIALLLSIFCAYVIQQNDHIIGAHIEGGLSEYRRLILRQNALYVRSHNQDPAKTSKLKLYPRFAALTVEQVRQKYFNYDVDVNIDPSEIPKIEAVKQYSPNKMLKQQGEEPQQIYVNYADIVQTPVRDQGACNSGYAYSIIDAFSMLNRQIRPESQLFSVQYLIDCSKYFGTNRGCSGGSILYSLLFNVFTGAIFQSQYPQSYQTINNGIQQRCKKSNAQHYRILMAQWHNEDQKDCKDTRRLSVYGPISVPIYTSPQFFYYHSGVIQNCTVYEEQGSSVRPNHAAILLGFKQSAVVSQNYLILKNSWGILWGEQGYFRVYDPPASVSNGMNYNRCYVCTRLYMIQKVRNRQIYTTQSLDSYNK